MATDTSEAELVHPKALPLRVGAQLIHADKLGEVEDNTMPIRRAVNSTRETPPKSKLAEGEEEKPEPDISSEESASTGEEQENETPPATSSETEQPKEVEKEEKGENKPSEETKKDEKDQTKEKEKKVKKTIPSWATLSASQLARAQKQTHMAASSRPKMDAILTEAIKACFQKTGASVVAIRKYIIHKYPSLELERRGYLLKQALKRELQRGVIRQVKGKGASGSFVVVPNAGKTVQKSKDRKKSSSTLAPEHQVKLEDVLPLAFTRLCEPKEASYSLIRKYVSQYYPKLKVDIRPQLLKNALQRAVEKGQLEQITGKGASGTFQLKRSGEKPLLGGSLMEDAILSAIAAMNEPKTCSTTALKKYVLENHPGTNSNFQVHLLKRTLQKCEKNGWMEQISGKGFSGTFQLCFPYYPSPGVLFPEKQQGEESEESEDDDSEEEDEEDSSEEEESEDDEPPPKKRLQKKAPAKSRGKATSAKQRDSKPKPKTPAAQRGKARPPPKKAPPKAKTPAKKTKPAPPAIKKSGSISSKKPAASGKKDGKSSTKGKSRKSLRAKK
ncbi:heterochromatin protein 1-binding protein 3 isoform X1 [Vombatus ursinus]|uniref:Heterochromatin protein 1-binding protein 3 n=2 Tax=Vombatus ursinus TaxID=29139 RepID=A0A4X2MBC0_VOMUR|nr:heterochromatin protein 1-binding protein 3 isoform X1 [Vombatus ursinus]XP_027697170.1 heterochromatin protein 1-binding protein 3 isoform X1 [Vombatus ursinus]XP_027697171.1 heterochromatin protein 1-binding protein 3 isoform X1 [Vombatus ursinus]